MMSPWWERHLVTVDWAGPIPVMRASLFRPWDMARGFLNRGVCVRIASGTPLCGCREAASLLFWEQANAGSSPVTRTTKPRSSNGRAVLLQSTDRRSTRRRGTNCGGRLRKDTCLSSRITRVQIPSAAPNRLYSLMDRVRRFERRDPGSTPGRGTNMVRVATTGRSSKSATRGLAPRRITRLVSAMDATNPAKVRLPRSNRGEIVRCARRPTAGVGGFKSRTVSVRI